MAVINDVINGYDSHAYTVAIIKILKDTKTYPTRIDVVAAIRKLNQRILGTYRMMPVYHDANTRETLFEAKQGSSRKYATEIMGTIK